MTVAATLVMATFNITGVSPLLMHNPSGMRRSTETVGRKKIPTPEDEAEASAYRNEAGNLYVQSCAFRAALLSACKGKRIGKRSAMAIMSGAAFAPDEQCELVDPASGDPITTYEIHSARCVIQKASIIRCRAIVRSWSCQLRLEVETLDVAVDHVQTLLHEAGRTIGVGDFRPEKKGPFGRFRAELIES